MSGNGSLARKILWTALTGSLAFGAFLGAFKWLIEWYFGTRASGGIWSAVVLGAVVGGPGAVFWRYLHGRRLETTENKLEFVDPFGRRSAMKWGAVTRVFPGHVSLIIEGLDTQGRTRFAHFNWSSMPLEITAAEALEGLDPSSARMLKALDARFGIDLILEQRHKVALRAREAQREMQREILRPRHLVPVIIYVSAAVAFLVAMRTIPAMGPDRLAENLAGLGLLALCVACSIWWLRSDNRRMNQKVDQKVNDSCGDIGWLLPLKEDALPDGRGDGGENSGGRRQTEP